MEQINQHNSVFANDKKKTNFLFNIITLGITALVFLLGILLLTRHLGDAYSMFDFLTNKYIVEPHQCLALQLSFLALFAVLTFLLVFFFRKKSELTFRNILFTFWIVLVGFEFVKQFMYAQIIVDGKLIYEYNWSYFPFQLCSLPYFILPFIIYLKDGKVRDAMIFLFFSVYWWFSWYRLSNFL